MLLEKRSKVVAIARSFGASPIAPPAVKRRLGIEELLRWSYRNELPKEAAPRRDVLPPGIVLGWIRMGKFLENLAVIDHAVLNRYGLLPDEAALSGPHPDAVRVGECVKELDEFELGLPEGWDPFGDLGDMDGMREGAVAEVLERLVARGDDGKGRIKTPPSILIRKYAILGGCPVWAAEIPEVKFISSHGMPKRFVKKLIVDEETGASYEIEVDGLSKKSRRPLANAYRKRYLDPSPVDAGVARGEYEIWRSALDVMAKMLDGALESFEIVRCVRSRRPWEEPERRPEVLYDLTYSKLR
jgi:hypothetical protein